ncbi:MAG TPA: multicopper oxidase domain-containing protein, partial [Candidatus Corynebacterium faecipullorum]|nr:multicopper oxidase domain-containing protein [Candidatus Corynebacterium faecipullorum]
MSSAPVKPQQSEKQWASWLIIIVALLAVIGLAVFNSATGKQDPATVASADAVTVDVSVDGMAFVPSSIDVAAGSHLVVNFTNTGDQVHDLKIGREETGRVEPGETVQLDAGVIEESVEGYCTIAGHKMQGMTFMVNVGESSSGEHDHAGASESTDSAGAPATVPSAAERMSAREGFEAFDASLAPAQGDLHEETWVMTEEEMEVAPGVRQTRWLFNGQAPGPTLRGKVGDTFRITIKNEGSMGHSVDFHAGEVNPDENMKTIQPGESLTYEFVAHRAGIWMYHCSTMPMTAHIAAGMAGAVIIDPPDLPQVDREYVLVQSEI